MQQHDVRRPKNIQPYPAKKAAEADDAGTSLYQFLALIFGLLSFMLKVKSII